MASDYVPGFGVQESHGSENGHFSMMKVKKKGGGGFQVMGLSYPVLKGIQKRGYKIPTPIQRKTIPVALQGRDLVAMARTGSGKTACFLIPIFEKLKARGAKTGARALIMSPTRELAVQTLHFIRELGRFVGLKAAVVLGGDSMDSQFEALHGNPDIIVATPGRFMHVCVEMELRLNSIEIVVFDEADRLFEMGFGEQLKEIIARLPSSRQTLLFSATLPKVIVEFTRAGLSNPILLRLDVESKLPEELELGFIWCRQEEKTATLLCLLDHILSYNINKLKQQIIIFAASKHHVEFLHLLLDLAGIQSTFLYSNLDQSARKINAAKFREGVVKVMVVTDVAARGIDIPDVGTVINYHFPAAPKLFVHRVGRCARAGRSGTAYSLIAREEVPYLVDLHLFLGRPLCIVGKDENTKDSGFVGTVPPDILEEKHSEVIVWHETKSDIEHMAKVSANAYTKYLKSRPGASGDSVRRAKLLNLAEAGPHPIFGTSEGPSVSDILLKMKSFKPSGTVFELSPKANSEELKAMKQKRSFHEKAIEGFHKKVKEREEAVHYGTVKSKLAPSKPEDLENIFASILVPRKRKFDPDYKKSHKKFKKSSVDTDNFIPYNAPDHHTEAGLALNSFEQAADKITMDLIGDDEKVVQRQLNAKKWDQRKKKYVGPKEHARKIRTESGVLINSTYKSGHYAQWKEKSKADAADSDSGESVADNSNKQQSFRGGKRGSTRGGLRGRGGKPGRPELRRPEQILKARDRQEKIRMNQKKGKKGRHKGRGGGRGRGGGGGRGRKRK